MIFPRPATDDVELYEEPFIVPLAMPLVLIATQMLLNGVRDFVSTL
jgi:small neutral amino acid transporter SnatA (MarC family)